MKFFKVVLFSSFEGTVLGSFEGDNRKFGPILGNRCPNGSVYRGGWSIIEGDLFLCVKTRYGSRLKAQRITPSGGVDSENTGRGTRYQDSGGGRRRNVGRSPGLGTIDRGRGLMTKSEAQSEDEGHGPQHGSVGTQE